MGDNDANNFEHDIDINSISFNNVNKDFESQFKERYKDSISMVSDSKDQLENASGAVSLDALGKIARQIKYYDKNSDFEKSFEDILVEDRRFTET
ncbi:MAG: hypothetical protein Q8942_14585 [Bacillota bacterium]|nr:hypothetical protein [Bacillota bacterium]